VNKLIKYSLLVLAIALVAYKSVYVEKLSVHNGKTAQKFDPVSFSKKIWLEQLPAKMNSAVALTNLIGAVAKEKEIALQEYTRALAIGNYRYALVKADLQVVAVNEDEVLATILAGDSTIQVKLATEFIYGNAVRDASGLIRVEDFPNTSDLNGISEELNRIVRTDVLPAVKGKLKAGDKLEVVAALELNKEHIHWQGIELYPVRIQLMP
jgi:predicted lipoprotein